MSSGRPLIDRLLAVQDRIIDLHEEEDDLYRTERELKSRVVDHITHHGPFEHEGLRYDLNHKGELTHRAVEGLGMEWRQ